MQNNSYETIKLSVLLVCYLILKEANWSESDLGNNGNERIIQKRALFT